MQEATNVRTDSENQFIIGFSNFMEFNNRTKCNGGALLLCRSGSADIYINHYEGQVFCNSFVIILPNSVLQIKNRSTDFQVEFFSFSHNLFADAAFRLEIDFFSEVRENPVSYLSAGALDAINTWFRMAEYTYNDRDNIFRHTIILNRFQNLLLDMYDKIQRSSHKDVRPGHLSPRQVDLFHRFALLVHEHCASEREVAFYADKLCISARYLSTIVRLKTFCTAKSFIDRIVMQEIKNLLHTSSMSVQEIAYRLHFPDQSYLGRYFKKHSGESPTEYRNRLQ